MTNSQPDPFAPLPVGANHLAGARTATTSKAERGPAVVMPAPLPLPETIHHRKHGTPSMLWQYRDAAGALLFAVARFDMPGGKEVLPYSCTATSWRWMAPPEPRPLYRLHDLAGRPAAPVLLVEGEKAAEAGALRFPDHVATTWPGGSNATGKADWLPLAGRAVLVWPDNDAPGRKAAAAVAEAAQKAGAASVAVVAVPSAWPVGWDVADALPEGVTLDDLAAMLAAAMAQAGAAVPDTNERHATLAAFSKLPQVERAAGRKDMAELLGMTRANLDAAVKAERTRHRADMAAEVRRRPEPEPGQVFWPLGVTMKADGLYCDAGDDAPPRWLAAPFEVLGDARNAASEDWALYLRWHDRDERSHVWPLPKRMLVAEPGAMEAELMRRGLRLSVDPTDQRALRRALAEVRAGSRVRLAYRAGWQDAAGGAFLLPDGVVIGTMAEAVAIDCSVEDAARLCATAGTLAEWQTNVAALAVGNPLAAFCMSAGLVGPLLLPLGVPGGGIHLTGESKRGKTLAAQMGLSCWGMPYKAAGLRDWNSTANGFEAAAEECDDMLLALDELHQANPAEVVRACYMLADGAGKSRLNRDASAKRRRTWRTFILSTGEHDLATAAAKAGQRLPAGADVRMPSLSVPEAGAVWPALHGRASLQAMWEDLHRAMPAQHGTAARAFLERLTGAARMELQAVAEAMRKRFDARLPANADPQVRDVARRFALVATAGTLATAWGVLPWPEVEAEQAAAAMLDLWLLRRPGGAGSGERAAHVERARLFLTQHGASRFAVLSLGEHGWAEAHPDRPVVNQAGWKRRYGRDGRDEFLIPPEVWKTELCAPAALDARAMAVTLAAAGFLRKGGDGRLMVKERVPGMKNPAWVYAVSAALLEAPEDGAASEAEEA